MSLAFSRLSRAASVAAYTPDSRLFERKERLTLDLSDFAMRAREDAEMVIAANEVIYGGLLQKVTDYIGSEYKILIGAFERTAFENRVIMHKMNQACFRMAALFIIQLRRTTRQCGVVARVRPNISCFVLSTHPAVAAFILVEPLCRNGPALVHWDGVESGDL
jgi:hypothetical protein